MYSVQDKVLAGAQKGSSPLDFGSEIERLDLIFGMLDSFMGRKCI